MVPHTSGQTTSTRCHPSSLLAMGMLTVYLAKSVDTEIIYSVGSYCTNLSTEQLMQNYSFDQSEADTILFSAYAVLRESGYSSSHLTETDWHALSQTKTGDYLMPWPTD